MNRRDLLKAVAFVGGAYALPAIAKPTDHVCKYGALVPTSPIRGKRFYHTFRPMRGLSKRLAKEGKNVFLWKHLEEEIGEIIPHDQSDTSEVEGEGDCVGQSGAMGCDVLAATDIHLRNESEKFIAKASVEMSYAGSRIEIGAADGTNHVEGRPGSRGEWMAKFYKQFGVLHRLVYDNPDGTKLDLTGYDPNRSRKYRDTGVPDWLEPTARKHPVREITNVKTGEEALDAICAGQPVILCSSYAFKDTRDKEGFCEAYGSYKKGFKWWRVQWWHAMILTGALLEGERTGGLIQNSHGKWNSGPQPHGIPDGSFFAELETIDKMVKDWGDCWALGSYTGHESTNIKRRIHKLWR